MIASKEVIDFTSSLYLGFNHNSQQIGPWTSLTTGKPAALYERPIDKKVANGLARLQGFEAGVLSKSTHLLFWDVIHLLSKKKKIVIYKDISHYPVVQAGLTSAANKGVKIYNFKAGDFQGLKRLIKSTLSAGFQPVIISEGWLLEKGCPAPLDKFYYLVKTYGGYLIVDDTQALGIIGVKPSKNNPYGYFGGGTFQYLGMDCHTDRIISITSLAKGFGVPLSVMSSNSNWIQDFLRLSKTRVHNSSPGVADVLAAENAIKLNLILGDQRRRLLLRNIIYFKKKLKKEGLNFKGHFFPIQILNNRNGNFPVNLYQRLLRLGYKVLLLKNPNNRMPLIGICITSVHSMDQINRLSNAISRFAKFNDQKRFFHE